MRTSPMKESIVYITSPIPGRHSPH